MYGVGASGGLKNHFSQDEEDALKKDESSTSIVRRETKSTVDISGSDRTWRAEKEHQKSVGENGLAAVEHTVHAAAEAAEMAGLEIFGAGVLAAASPVLGAALALRLGLGELNEAHVRGEDQAIALARDNGHVALVGALDLPDSYKTKRLEGDFAHVSKGPNTPSGKMTQGVMNQKGDLATLQLHADRGMNAARDLSRSGAKVEAFPGSESEDRRDLPQGSRVPRRVRCLPSHEGHPTCRCRRKHGRKAQRAGRLVRAEPCAVPRLTQ